MLVSFLILAEAFGPGSIDSKASRQAAEMVFKDILDAGIIVDCPGLSTLNEIEKQVSQLRPELKQRLLILVEELKKQRKVVVASPSDGLRRTVDALVRDMKPDAAITARGAASTVRGVTETTAVDDYLDSATRSRISACLSPSVPIAHLDASQVDAAVGAFLKYARSVTVLDKMVGRASKTGTLEAKFAGGLKFIAECWSRNSVYSRDKLELVVVTVAGDCGAAAGYIDACTVTRAVRAALTTLNVSLKIVLKQDDTPPLFHARYLKAKGRCVKIDPGIDALARGGEKSRCLQIDPTSEATNAIARDILKLPELAPCAS